MFTKAKKDWHFSVEWRRFSFCHGSSDNVKIHIVMWNNRSTVKMVCSHRYTHSHSHRHCLPSNNIPHTRYVLHLSIIIYRRQNVSVCVWTLNVMKSTNRIEIQFQLNTIFNQFFLILIFSLSFTCFRHFFSSHLHTIRYVCGGG
jgi:hypothetical protein